MQMKESERENKKMICEREERERARNFTYGFLSTESQTLHYLEHFMIISLQYVRYTFYFF